MRATTMQAWGAMTLAALIGGAWIGLAGLYGAVLLGVMVAVALALLLPWSWLWIALLVAVFALIGPLQYFAGIDKAFWVPYLMALVMGIRALGEWWARPRARHEGAGKAAELDEVNTGSGPAWIRVAWTAMGLWLMVMVVSSMVHRIGPLQWLVAGKEVLFLWAIPLVFGLGLMGWRELEGLWRWATVWLVLQVPVVAWQRLFVAPSRGGDSPWDAVVGTFAGRASGGGGSGTMALVSLWAASLVVLSWRQGRAPGPWAVAALVAALLACAMAEVKVALLVAPLLALFLVGRDRSKGSGSGWWLLPVAAVLSVGLLVAHQWQFASRRSAEGQSMERYLGTIVERNLDERSTADTYGQLTRVGALRWWWQQQRLEEVPGWLVGHGIGAARRSHLVVGEVARTWRMDIGRSTAAVMLWETGVLGLLAWVVGVAAWARAAWVMAAEAALREHRALLRSASAIAVLALLSLPYGADLIEAPHLSTALMVGIGITLAAARSLRRATAPVPHAAVRAVTPSAEAV